MSYTARMFGVIERRRRACLLLESLQAIGIGGVGGRQHLDRDVAAEAGIVGTVDLAHSARADASHDVVGTEAGAGGEGHEGTRASYPAGLALPHPGMPIYVSVSSTETRAFTSSGEPAEHPAIAPPTRP